LISNLCENGQIINKATVFVKELAQEFVLDTHARPIIASLFRHALAGDERSVSQAQVALVNSLHEEILEGRVLAQLKQIIEVVHRLDLCRIH